MILACIFLVVFVGGPFAFRQLLSFHQSCGAGRLIRITAVLACGGLGLRYGFPAAWGRDVGLTLTGIGLIWLAWIAILTVGAAALRQVDQGLRMRRWTAVIGAAGTTMPWFGLALARLGMAGI